MSDEKPDLNEGTADGNGNGENGSLENLTPQEAAAVRANPALFLTRSLLMTERQRVAAQVRVKHLARQKRKDPNTEIILEGLIGLEDRITGLLADFVKGHPAYPWFSRVKGIGDENIGKVAGFLDPRRANSISGFWKFAGYHVTDEGKAPKAVRGGGKLAYNKTLRTMCFRLGVSLMKAGGKFMTEIYEPEKAKLQRRYRDELGWTIVKAAELPKKNGKKYEPDGVISEGHIHLMALRKMIKIFLACLWLVWREAEGLPVTAPYAIAVLGHASEHFIDPWSLCDRPEKKPRRSRKAAA